MKELEIRIKGMVCGGCENRVKNVLSEINDIESVEANHNTGVVRITSKNNLDITQIENKIKELGYEIIEE